MVLSSFRRMIAATLVAGIGCGFAGLAAAEEPAASRAPARQLVYLGGGGGPSGRSTVFDDDLPALKLYVSEPGVETRALYDGGHELSEKAGGETFGASLAGKMELSAVEGELARLKGALRQGSLRSGDQVLLVLASHGAPAKAGTDTHSIATSDGKLWSLDELKELRDQMEAHGVRLGIVDLSCYSGATQKLADDKTCVVSGAPANFAATAGFGGELLGALHSGTSLEAAYLQGRDGATRSISLPQISSPAGKTVAEVLEPLVARMIYRDSDEGESSTSPELQLNRLISDARDCRLWTSRARNPISRSCENSRSACGRCRRSPCRSRRRSRPPSGRSTGSSTTRPAS